MPVALIADPDIQRKIQVLIGELVKLKFDQESQRMELFLGLLKILPVEGPSTILQLDRFFSELYKGTRGKPHWHYHHNEPTEWFKRYIWKRITYKSKSNIEKTLYRLRGDGDFNAARLVELETVKDWKWIPQLFFIKITLNITDLAYLWIRCSSNDLWVICLRRLSSESNFSKKELAILYTLGSCLSNFKQTWYLQKIQGLLTETERKVVVLISRKKSRREAAQELNISLNTYNEHIKKIMGKLDAHKYAEILSKLEND